MRNCIFRDENCQGCRKKHSGDRPNMIEIIFANDTKLMLSAKTKTDQEDWALTIMKGLSQGVGLFFQNQIDLYSKTISD